MAEEVNQKVINVRNNKVEAAAGSMAKLIDVLPEEDYVHNLNAVKKEWSNMKPSTKFINEIIKVTFPNCQFERTQMHDNGDYNAQ